MPGASLSLTEYITEIRYKPNAKVLDYRGTWAEKIKALTELPRWRITENRVDVFTDDDTARAFVSFKNAGFVLQDSPTRNYFPDQTNKLFRFLFQQEAFGSSVTVPRIGVRFRCAISFDGSFEDLLERYTDRLLAITPQAQQAFGGKTVDIGGSVNMTTPLGKINTTSGPMEEKQLKQFFPNRKAVPTAALYLDMDYYKEPNSEMISREIISSVRLFSESLWDIKDNLVQLVLS